MSADNNRPANDPLEAAIAALRSDATNDDPPSPELIRTTIELLRRLESEQPAPSPQRGDSPAIARSSREAAVSPGTHEIQPASIEPAGRPRRMHPWVLAAAALGAVVVIAITRGPTKPPGGATEQRIVGPIVVTEINPAGGLSRMEEQLAQAQSEVKSLIDDANRLAVEEQITRLLADNLVASSRAN